MAHISTAGRKRITAGLKRYWAAKRAEKAARHDLPSENGSILASWIQVELRAAIRDEVRNAIARLAESPTR